MHVLIQPVCMANHVGLIKGEVQGRGPRHAMGIGETSHQEGNVCMFIDKLLQKTPACSKQLLNGMQQPWDACCSTIHKAAQFQDKGLHD